MVVQTTTTRRSRAGTGGTGKFTHLASDASRFEQRVLAAEVSLGRSRGELGSLAGCIERSAIDLNPHQVKAAIFALDALERGGAILADEVGLGKTIEAALVMRQLWSEGRRRILVLAPAPLRRQWQHELETKFQLPSEIRDARAIRAAERQLSAAGAADGGSPWEAPAIVIASMPFAYNRREEIEQVDWDLVVIDEAHRLRGVGRGSSKQAAGIRDALEGRAKLLLTATPFQNDLIELYGLVSFIDPTLLGTDYSFQVRYVGRDSDPAETSGDLFGDLRDRLEPIVNRTLRKEVSSYLQFTERHSMLVHFRATDAEEALRGDVSAYIASEDSVIFQGPRRALLALVYHKLLASSSYALAASLEKLVNTLRQAKADAQLLASFRPEMEEFDGAFDEQEEESLPGSAPARRSPDVAAIDREVKLVQSLAARAKSIVENAKADALLLALQRGFAAARERREPTKAVVFTESRVTQAYLRQLLEAKGHAGRVVTFNGTNNDPESQDCYARWVAADPDRRKLPREIGVREALVERFRGAADVLVATEAAAEGLNLQFCNMVVNYDLPWNPQRIEQRIGRCHRYGQLHDVVVINLIDESNPVDQRVHELLERKFCLFDGVFGVSDSPLGEIASSFDLERSIVEILQRCRTPVEIKGAFDRLSSRIDEATATRSSRMRQDVLDNFHPDLAGDLLGLEEATRQHVGELDRRLARTLVSACAPPRKDRISEYIFRVDAYPPELCEPVDGGKLEPGLLAVGARRRDPSVACQSVTLDHPLARTVLELRRNLDPELMERFVLRSPNQRASKLLGLEDGATGFWEVIRVEIPGQRGNERLLHIIGICKEDSSGKSTVELLPESTADELLLWETGADEPREMPDDEDPRLPAAFAAELARRLQGIDQELRRGNMTRMHEEFSRADRYAAEQLLEVEDKLAQLRRELPKLRAEHETALAAGDAAAEETARRLLDKLEERLISLRRERIRLEEEQLTAGETLRTRRKAELACQPRSERVVLGHFRVERS